MSANLNGAGTNIDGAASRIKQLMEPEGPTDEQQTTEEAPAELETQESDTEAQEERYKVKVGGEEQEVTLDDLRKGYMMESDYRLKTAQIGEQRRAFEEKQAQVESKLSEVEALLTFEANQLESEEMRELREIDPDEYLKRYESLKQRAEQFSQFKAEQAKAAEEKRAELIRQEGEKLLNAIPDYLDHSKAAAESPKLLKALESVGYSNDELNRMSDHRIMVLGRKAMLYDELQAQNPRDKIVKEKPKAATPGTTGVSDDRSSDLQKARDRLRRSGSQKDAAAAIRRMIGN